MKDEETEKAPDSQEFRKIHAKARRQFDTIITKEQNEREQCREDRRFYAVSGAQWEDHYGEQFENKPRLEGSKISNSVTKIFSAFRKNPVSAKFLPRDGIDNQELSDLCAGLFRSDEADSTAQEAYDNAFEEGVSGGIGGFRLTTVYEDEEDDEDDRQRIVWEPIYDADQSMFFDPNAKRYDKSDSEYAFLLTPYSREAYEEEFDDNPASWPDALLKEGNFDWVVDDCVWVAEYFVVEREEKEVIRFRDAMGEVHKYEKEELNERIQIELSSLGAIEVGTKTITKRRIRKYTMSGGKVLTRPQYLAGKMIPIVPYYGKRLVIDNIERCSGQVRIAKDAQRLFNMQLSQLADIASRSSYKKPIFFQEQIEGHEGTWQSDAVENYAYLVINMIEDASGQAVPAGAAGFTSPPEIPPAMAALYEVSSGLVPELLGNEDGGEEIVSNIGKETVEQIHARMDMRTFIYVANFARSVMRCAQIWLSMAQDIYTDEGRRMKTVTEDNETNSVVIGQKETDISKAKLQVTTTVAPASATRKAATVRNMMNMAKISEDPEVKTVIGLIAAMNAEGEGTEALRKFARTKLVALGIVKPTEEEQAELEDAQAKEGEQSDPQAVYLQAEAEKAKAQAEEARARTEKMRIDAKKTDAEILKIFAEMEAEEHDRVVESVRLLEEMRQNQTSEAAPSVDNQGFSEQ
jgi:hypothetical protein